MGTCLARAQFGLFHGDPHPGNIFALRDGRIAYVDFGNVAELSQSNKQTLIDAVVHAVNEDYYEMACDFIKLVRSYICQCAVAGAWLSCSETFSLPVCNRVRMSARASLLNILQVFIFTL